MNTMNIFIMWFSIVCFGLTISFLLKDIVTELRRKNYLAEELINFYKKK